MAPWGGRHRPRTRPGSPRARLVEAPGSPSPVGLSPGGAEPRPGSAPVSCSSAGPGRDNFSCHGAGGALAPPRCGGGWIRLTALPASHLGSVAAPEGGDSTQKGGGTQARGWKHPKGWQHPTERHPWPPGTPGTHRFHRGTWFFPAHPCQHRHRGPCPCASGSPGPSRHPGEPRPGRAGAAVGVPEAAVCRHGSRRSQEAWLVVALGKFGAVGHVSPCHRVTMSPCHRVPMPRCHPRCALAVPWGWVPWGRCGNAVGSWVARVCRRQKPHPGAGGPGCHRSRVAQAGGNGPVSPPLSPPWEAVA